MNVDLFVRSYDGDSGWLQYCLRSIHRFATGFRRVVVVVPHGHNPPVGTAEVVFRVAEIGEQYVQQQSDKMHADHFSDADFITFTDSDTIFTRPISPADLIVEDRVRWLYTPYSSIDSGDGQTWKPVTAKFMGHPVENEMMRRHPFTVPRWAFEALRAWVHRTHGVTLERYFMTQPLRECSEFNFMAAYLWFHHHDKVEWQNTDDDLGTVYVEQKHSWGGLSDRIRGELERALA